MTPRDLAAPVLALAVCAAACHGSAPAPPTRAIRFLHTFGAREAELLDKDLASWPDPVTTSLVPFARGQTVIGTLLRNGRDCPDLIRIDATWLPALARAGLLAPAPADVAGAAWLPEARALATDRGTMWAAPQTVDGLVVLIGPGAARPGALPSTAPATIDQLIAAGEQAQRAGVRWGLGLRVDGYWLVPFLRAAGADVADGATGTLGIDRPGAAGAVTRFASLFGHVAAPAAPPGQEAADEARRFRSGEVALLVTGPWAIPDAAKGELDQLSVWPMPDAPRGGQLLVVPRCAAAPAAAWKFARHLTAPDVQAAWARELGTVPTTKAALAAAPRAVQEAYAALQAARPLPRDPMTALLFDDLTPAVAAVVAGDATADEALAGVERAWSRMLATRAAEAGGGATDGGAPDGGPHDAPDGGAP